MLLVGYVNAEPTPTDIKLDKLLAFDEARSASLSRLEIGLADQVATSREQTERAADEQAALLTRLHHGELSLSERERDCALARQEAARRVSC